MRIKPAQPKLRRGHWSTDGLIWCPTLSEGSGNRAHDIAGRDWHGTLTNMSDSSWVGGPRGTCLDFDGSDDRVAFPDFKIAPNSHVTVAVWCNADSRAGNRTFLSSATSSEFILWLNPKAQFILNSFSTNDRVTAAADIALQGWSFVVGRFNGATLDVFVEGALSGSLVPTGSWAGVTAGGLSLGTFNAASGANVWDGRLDLPMIWNRALTDAQIAELYREPLIYIAPPSRIWMLGAVPSAAALEVDLDGIASGEAVFALAVKNGVALNTVATGEQAFAPTINLRVAPGFVASGETVHPLAAGLKVAPGFIASGEQVFGPGVQLRVAPPFLPSGEQTFAMGVQSTVSLSAIASGEQAFAPTINLRVAPEFVPSTEQTFSLGVGLNLAPGFIPSGETVPPLAVSVEGAVVNVRLRWPVLVEVGAAALSVEAGRNALSVEIPRDRGLTVAQH